MSVVKVVEIIAQSEKSWEDAVQNALKETAKTVRNIKSIYVKGFQVKIEKDRITEYRVDTQISFVVEHDK